MRSETPDLKHVLEQKGLQSFGIPVGRFNIVCLFPCSVVPAAPGLPLLLFLGLRLFLFDAIAVGLVVA